MGKMIEPVVVDGASDWPLFAEKAKQLLQQDKVAVTFGCWTSVSRKSVLPAFEENKGLLFYPVQYEGEEMSPNIWYTAEAVNQQATPAVDYMLAQRADIINPSEMLPVKSLEAVVWCAVGGRGTLVGPILGAVGVNWLKTWSTTQYPEFWLIILGMMFILVVLLLPRGIVGGLTDLWKRMKNQPPAEETDVEFDPAPQPLNSPKATEPVASANPSES